MPLMAPINWLFLFIMFSMILLLFNMLNYYSVLPESPESKTSTKIMKTSLNWKW